ncbi:DNA polymerase III subunit epsilon [Colwellia psychrerythraea]|uniref:DNA polymerase III subunit epsilon n=1 Tax=Colwellia psychrerythraea TaxID=28229 RepID=A0A099KKD6_COLPS|nr:DNA polymerase III subunit epsilon [Colwellia psychrerythraea]KGJ90033.1 DNA polymerase III, epsilon subunit [Colwellia psychrerythraea]
MNNITDTQNLEKDKRLIILDTETTGINPREGHRIVEIGCVEMINRQLTGRIFHAYIKPLDQRGQVLEMEQEVIDIHGLTNEFLNDKPIFSQVVHEFIDFIRGAELVIHNAKFDVGFMDHEFSLFNSMGRSQDKVPMTEDICTVTDTLKVSKDEFGSPKTLDYLARFYRVDKLVDRTYHGALIDAQLLAFVYIEMTRKQSSFNLTVGEGNNNDENAIRRLPSDRNKLKVITASADEIEAHTERVAIIGKKGGEPLWK